MSELPKTEPSETPEPADVDAFEDAGAGAIELTAVQLRAAAGGPMWVEP